MRNPSCAPLAPPSCGRRRGAHGPPRRAQPCCPASSRGLACTRAPRPRDGRLAPRCSPPARSHARSAPVAPALTPPPAAARSAPPPTDLRAPPPDPAAGRSGGAAAGRIWLGRVRRRRGGGELGFGERSAPGLMDRFFGEIFFTVACGNYGDDFFTDVDNVAGRRPSRMGCLVDGNFWYKVTSNI